MTSKSTPAIFTERLSAYVIERSLYWLIFWMPLLWITKVDTLAELVTRLIQHALIFWLPLMIVLAGLELWLLPQYGASIGKLVTGLRVHDGKSKQLSIKMLIFREYIAKRISSVFLWAGFWWMLRDSKGRTWHDMLAATSVTQHDDRRYVGEVVAVASVLTCIYVLWSLYTTMSVNYPPLQELLYVFEPLKNYSI